MRAPFYGGLLAFGWPLLFDSIPPSLDAWVPLGPPYLSALEVPLMIVIVSIMLYFPFTPLLLVPAIQLRSWKVARRALWLGPVLTIAYAILSTIFAIDNRILSCFPILLVPGGFDQMNPGGPIWFLLPKLAIYIALVTFALRRTYGKTQILRFSYTARVLIGGFILFIALGLEIYFTTVAVDWSEIATISVDEIRRKQIIAAITWLCLSGAYWAFVFGVKPEEPMPVMKPEPAVSN